MCSIDDSRDMRQERHREDWVHCFRRVLSVAGKGSDFASPTPQETYGNIWRLFLVVITWEDGATGSRGVEARDVANILQCTGQPHNEG